MAKYISLSIIVTLSVSLVAESLYNTDFVEQYEKNEIAPRFGWDKYFEEPSLSVEKVYAHINKDLSVAESLTNYEGTLDILDNAADAAFKCRRCVQLTTAANKEAASDLGKLKAKLRGHDCDMETFRLKRKINAAVNGNAVDRSTGVPELPLDRALKWLLMKHANRCGVIYFKRFQEARKGINHTFEQVETFASGFMDGLVDPGRGMTWPHRLRKLPNSIMVTMDTRYIPHYEMGRAFRALESLTQADTDAKFVRSISYEQTGEVRFDEEKFKALFQKYVIVPCKNYIKETGQIFIPAGFDMLSQLGSFESSDTSEVFEFNKALLYYRICVRTIFDDAIYSRYKSYAKSVPTIIPDH